MAISSPSQSPAVTIREIDLTGVAPNVSTSTGATVGNFRWGPVNERVLVSGETDLVARFAAPTEESAVDFHSASYFLKYSDALYIVRANSDGKNAHSATTKLSDSSAIIENATDWDNSKGGMSEAGVQLGSFVAKYPGALGNALSVSFCPAGGTFSSWTYKSSFDEAPGTSAWAAKNGGSNDEIHVAVIDRTGALTGSPGTVVETFSFLSMATGAQTTDGSPNNVSDVINNGSSYIWNGYFGSDIPFGTASENFGALINSATTVDVPVDYAISAWTNALSIVALGGGTDSTSLGQSDYLTAFDLFEDADQVLVDFLIVPQMASSVDQVTLTNGVTALAVGRKDCVAVSSPNRTSVVGASDPTTSILSFVSTVTSSSYLIVDNNFIKVFDKYNDNYIYIPAASSTAGLMAATDKVAAPWFSPAGQRRGNYLGVTDLATNPNKSQRDLLYKAAVNPIANIPGQGVILFGDKTFQRRPSAFDRINVRRLFLAIERSIAIAGKNVMFEFNDEFTRAEFVNIVEPLLREIKGRRGITDFRVVCDETNNTGAVIDRNEFVASIFIKPARSINFVTLNFVAVRTGVEFEEIVGTV
tara:strand:- start:5490 stop:7253 length:1764 start_codon:yes stop_codon:yes gene_type:complete